MKKLFLPAMICAALLSSQNASADANIYASELKVNTNSIINGQVQFVLNAEPKSVAIEFWTEGATEPIYTLPVEGLTKGVNKVDIKLGDIEQIINKGEVLTWKVVASADANASVSLFSDASDASQMLAYPTHIAVDKNQKSDFFGRIYVNEAYAYTYSEQERNTTMGIYVFNSAFEDATNQGQTAWDGGVSWVANGWKYSSPCMLYVGENGDVFVSDWTDSHSGVWVMDPANPGNDFKPVFAGTIDSDTGIATENEVEIHGSISGICVLGEGENRMLYTYDEDLGNGGQIMKYEIGNLTESWSVAPSSIFYDNTVDKMVAGQSVVLRSDNRGGLWACQHRSNDLAEGAGYQMLVHMNSNGEVDWTSNGEFTLTECYGMDVTTDGTMLAIGGSKKIVVWNVTFDADGIPSLEEAVQIAENVSTKSFGVAFDAAGNLYLSDNSDHIRAFALPKSDNSFTTTANATLIADETTGVEGVAVDANAPVEYYNLQGVKVATPENGLFIKKQGAKVSKVVL